MNPLEYWSIVLIMTIRCYQMTSTGLMLLTLLSLIKQVEILDKEIKQKPQMKTQYTQTIEYQKTEEHDSEASVGQKVKKRRSHRNGKREYLRKWQKQ